MALTGAFFVLFVIAHMYGNLKAFAGHDAYNEYAEHLRTVEPALPSPRSCFVVAASRPHRVRGRPHRVRAGVVASSTSRPHDQVRGAPDRPSVSRVQDDETGRTRTSPVPGVAPRELHHREGEREGGATNDPYLLVVDTFSVWWSTLLYLAAMVLLGLHLWHGTWSAAQTLGWTGSATVAVPRAWWPRSSRSPLPADSASHRCSSSSEWLGREASRLPHAGTASVAAWSDVRICRVDVACGDKSSRLVVARFLDAEPLPCAG